MDSQLPALFDFPKRRSAANPGFRLEEVLSATKYKPSSFKTYVAKGFFAPWIVVLGGDRYRVKNLDLDWASFERTMWQVRAGASAPIANEESWRTAVADLMAQGLNFLASRTRWSLMSKHTPDVYVLPNRPSFVGGMTDSIEYAWMVRPRQRRGSGSVRILSLKEK